jgi:hypothetical protein
MRRRDFIGLNWLLLEERQCENQRVDGGRLARLGCVRIGARPWLN